MLDYFQAQTLLGGDEQLVMQSVRSYVDAQLMPHIAGWWDDADLPVREVMKGLGAQGLLGPTIAEEYGGSAASYSSYGAMMYELERCDSGLRSAASVQGSLVMHPINTYGSEEQKRAYLPGLASGELIGCFGLTEPDGGSDPGAMRTRAVKDGDHWVINGRKIWVSRVPSSDFTILMAVTDPALGSRGGITAFIVDRDTPGFEIEREIPMLGGLRTYELRIEDLRLHDRQVLGEVGQGFAPMQKRLTVRRLEIGARGVGMACRALAMMCQHVQQREVFGEKLADRQSIQWWIADAATNIHVTRLLVQDAARKADRGEDIRTEASMVKVFSTEMASQVVDHAMQSFGALGMTREMPFGVLSQRLRMSRIYEGPTEVHRMVIARRAIRQYEKLA